MKREHISIQAAIALAAIFLAGAATAADLAANPGAGPAVTTATKDPHGTYLVDANGMSLYLFKSDQQGSGKSTCHNNCAEAWPPLHTDGQPRARGEVDESLLGTIKRKDGTRQITYNGWPLYYYIKDKDPGDTEGQDVKGFGAEWYLITPNGEPAPHEDEEN